MNSRLAEEDLDFLKIIEESKLTAYAHPPGEEKMDTGLEPDQGLVILMIDEGLPSDQVENTLPNSSDEENNRDQEFSQARQSKSPRKSPLAKKKKRQPKLVALKPLKFAEMHKRAKV